MLTIEDVRAVPLFSTLPESRARAPGADLRRHAAAARRVRRARRRRARALRRALGQARGRQAVRRRRAHPRLAPARHDLRRGAAGLRHAVSRRLPRRRAVARHARRAAPLLRRRRRGARGRREARRAGARAHRRPAGRRDAGAQGAGHGLRRSLGSGLRRPAPLPRRATRSPHDWSSPDAPDADAAWAARCPPATERPVAAPRRRHAAARGRRCATLAERLGLQTRPRAGRSTTPSIIGGGPAGLAAAVYGASEGLRTLVIEREAPGGQAGTSSRIENYLGFPNGVSGDELASRALQQARRLGAEILVTRTVASIDPATPRGRPRRRRARAGEEPDPRHRRVVAAARDRGLRPADRQGHLLRRGAQRGRARPTARTSSSSAPATRPARRRCTSPTMRAR